MKVLVLGGAGAMGMVTVRDLAECSEVSEVIIGDSNLKQAEKVKKWANSEKVSVHIINITNQESLTNSISQVDVVANAAPYHLNLQVANAAIRAKKPFTDLGGVYYMTIKQLKLHKKARKAGVTGVIGCGLAPGIADVLARYGAEKLSQIDEVHIRYGEVNRKPVKYKWTFRTVLEEYTQGPVIYVDGKYEKLPPFSGKHTFKFPEPIGERTCCFALYSGIATLPRTISKGVRLVDCAMSYIDKDEQRIHILNEMGLTRTEPIRLNGVEISPQEFLIKCAPPPDVNVKDTAGIVVEIIGKKNGFSSKYTYSLIRQYHKEYGVSALAYLTGMPMSVVAQMLAKDEELSGGIFPMELGIDSSPLFVQLAKRGVEILETCQTSHLL
ncbi:MAG: saccharopine dehydrogenase NADP-binding domain-containing protein [Candidatus Bathyarchaeota archaeon]|nr:MAG: saccharopine dehydrogenase NADP-binding domain-containing protein [Candidatus Bathyarchaeota archaeon]